MHEPLITSSSITVGGLSKAFVLGLAKPMIIFARFLEISIFKRITKTINYEIKAAFDFLRYKINCNRILAI